MSDWVSVVSNVGFPVAVTLYLLLRIEGKLDMLSGSIGELSASIHLMKER
ncbi:YvrJ family protein [Aneurinibacillus terranovensis]|nr:YvrJ family protein [Aneurinibacillus terranovensis]